jgi:hypothetical protein
MEETLVPLSNTHRNQSVGSVLWWQKLRDDSNIIHAVIKLFKVSFGKQAIHDFLSQQNTKDAILPTKQFHQSFRLFFTADQGFTVLPSSFCRPYAWH